MRKCGLPLLAPYFIKAHAALSLNATVWKCNRFPPPLTSPSGFICAWMQIYNSGKMKGVPTFFQNIPLTFWWCIVTLCTVGYGDTYVCHGAQVERVRPVARFSFSLIFICPIRSAATLGFHAPLRRQRGTPGPWLLVDFS